MDGVKVANRSVFLASVLVTGAVAGAFIWLLLFLINLGISLLWDRVPLYLGRFYPLIVCVIGGVVIGLFTRRYGPYPEDMRTVMAKVKADGGYDYRDLGPMSAGALLPLMFGGSIGPEAGLVGSIAAVCTWVGDRLKRFGNGFRELSRAGTYAALSAIFTAPLYGLATAVDGSRVGGDGDEGVTRVQRILISAVAIVGAVGAVVVLTHLFGGGMSLPRYSGTSYGTDELLWLVPMALVGGLAGWLFHILEHGLKHVSDGLGDRHVTKAVIAGALLGLCGMVLPFTMFAGEVQAEELNEVWMTMSVATLLATGFLKIAVTALCVNMGWRGGHFFPVIFSGISIGYGLAMALGLDPVFCVCAVTASVVGGVMRRPLMAVLLLFLCFPVQSVLVLAAGAAIGSVIPLPRGISHADGTDGL